MEGRELFIHFSKDFLSDWDEEGREKSMSDKLQIMQAFVCYADGFPRKKEVRRVKRVLQCSWLHYQKNIVCDRRYVFKSSIHS